MPLFLLGFFSHPSPSLFPYPHPRPFWSGPEGGFGTEKTSAPTTKKSKTIDTINFEETFNPTPEDVSPTVLGTPKRGSSKRSLRKTKTVDTINFEETFNPTPEGVSPTVLGKPKKTTSSPTASPVKGDHTKKDKGDHTKKDKTVKEEEEEEEEEEEAAAEDDGVFETFAPTPRDYGVESWAPTPKDFDAETHAPSPENLYPTGTQPTTDGPSDEPPTTDGPSDEPPTSDGPSDGPSDEHRTLKGDLKVRERYPGRGLNVDTINFEETFTPTPENYPTSAQPPRGLKKGTFHFAPKTETYAPTPENKKSSSKSSKKSSGKRALVDGVNFEETFTVS